MPPRRPGDPGPYGASEAARRPALKVARVSAYIKDGIAGSSRKS
ncbi:hypothetical protein [Micromonospora sp. IBHARD004]